jgi:hypothetical protein
MQGGVQAPGGRVVALGHGDLVGDDRDGPRGALGQLGRLHTRLIRLALPLGRLPRGRRHRQALHRASWGILEPPSLNWRGIYYVKMPWL